MGRSRVAVVAMGRYGALCVAVCAAGGRSRVAVMPMELCMSVCATRCRWGALTSSCDAYGCLWGGYVCMYVPRCAAGGRSRVAVMPMGLCMYVCAARCRRGALTSSCDAYGALWGAVCCHVPLGGAHE